MKIKVLLSLTLLVLFMSSYAQGQSTRGSIQGTVVDAVNAVLQGARVELQPGGQTTSSDTQGSFHFLNLVPGSYTIKVTFVGFSPYTSNVTVGTQTTTLTATLAVSNSNQQVLVTANRAHGEAEAVNRELTAENILQVLPHDIITSLPNANVADAIGRLPSVTLERDEGEGKYVQIRGTEPRFSNVTIDGVNVPSPENVRQIKLDIVPADLVESVEINKTLLAHSDGDAIGGSINLRTKTANERPTIEAFSQGGYTPIINGRTESQFGITLGRRFGATKRLGVIGGFTYDFNGRGIDDVEPVPVANQLADGSYVASYAQADLREYRYYRDRYGYAGSFDYKLTDQSNIYAHLLYSHFNNFGDRWDYNLSSVDGSTAFDAPGGAGFPGNVAFGAEQRRPVQVIGSLAIGGNQFFKNSVINYEVAVGRAATDEHGYQNATFGNSDSTAPINNVQFGVDLSKPLVPRFPVLNGVNIYDPTQYFLQKADIDYSYGPQVNVQGGAGFTENYSVGDHHGIVEFGAKFRNVHKFQNSNDIQYALNPETNPAIPFTQFPDSFRNNHYYNGGEYQFGPVTDVSTLFKFIRNNPGVIAVDPLGTLLGNAGGNFSFDEFIPAGYFSNSITMGKFELYTGLRFESTSERLQGNVVIFPADGSAPTVSNQVTHPSYVDVLPTMQLRYALPSGSSVRFVYGRGFARPDYQDLPPSLQINLATGGGSGTISAGNPNLKPTHSNNYDLLYETELKPFGLFQAGIFYKDITSPIYATQRYVVPGDSLYQEYPNYRYDQSVNGTSAWLWGFEVAYEQKFSFLPGLFSGFGFSGNYSYTDSLARGLLLRTDQPHLLRQSPNTFNLSPTYDKGSLSVRLGVTYNQANIDFYQYQNEQYQTDPKTGNPVLDGNGNPIVIPNPVPLGIKGPNGDNYFYTHTQIDLQGSYHIKGPISVYAYGLNLNNEVFGFYNGSTTNVVQREFYQPTVAAGVRWSLSREK
ncbi:TonB-dependent receptor [Acidisarcina polymorpha]|uniref:TonB-dependent receptor n=1 Tax=Acidisarcina polymorpha TaxID=2211140 RepID=A0A2Z5G1R5_9BACT|nr:TonB-dependent receptor [Acidisarcina polymorpha]AXC13012.1 TonB-dependent receptor [Acidisarcina polymorpha]